MLSNKKIEAGADKLLDTGKRNNLISFKDTKASMAEILVPDCESVFSKCAVGRSFEIIDPKMPDEDSEEFDEVNPKTVKGERVTRDEYKERYASLVRNDKAVLVYSQSPNPMKAAKSIAKKAKEELMGDGFTHAQAVYGARNM